MELFSIQSADCCLLQLSAGCAAASFDGAAGDVDVDHAEGDATCASDVSGIGSRGGGSVA